MTAFFKAVIEDFIQEMPVFSSRVCSAINAGDNYYTIIMGYMQYDFVVGIACNSSGNLYVVTYLNGTVTITQH